MKEEIFVNFNLKKYISTIWKHLHDLCNTKNIKITSNDVNLAIHKECCLNFQQYEAKSKAMVSLGETRWLEAVYGLKKIKKL